MQGTPFLLRDFRQGRYTKASVEPFLIPENSVSFSQNVNFDTIVGSGVVRPGTTKLGSTVASGKTPLGFSEFVGKNGSPNLLLAVYTGASTASIYYYDGSWHTSGVTNLSNSAKDRFAVLGGSAFITNNVDGMKDSTDGNTWGTTNSIASGSFKPGYVFRYTARLLAAGDTTYPSRVMFSSIVNSAVSPFITWNADATTGDFIDINPDDGGYVTGFSETSTFVLVFKNTGMYRLDTIAKTTDPENIFNIGAVAQESIVLCQGITYFFSGQDIRRTNGGYPEQISRAGVQDIVDAIPQSSWTSVAAGTDGLNVYFFVGTVTLNSNQTNQRTITNCALKFSPRDQSWSVHGYEDSFRNCAQYTTTAGRTFVGADISGDVQTINSGTTDNAAAINYNLETQEIEFGNRATVKKIANKIVVFTNFGLDSLFSIKADDGDFKPVEMTLNNRVNVGRNVNTEGHFLTFKWEGETTQASPIFEGFYIQEVTDRGIIDP